MKEAFEMMIVDGRLCSVSLFSSANKRGTPVAETATEDDATGNSH
jgi:hypothetical protein